MVNLAIVGDVHLHFSEADVAYFNASTYDLILFVGDLSNHLPRRGYEVATLIGRLEKPALFIPGNHDTVNLFQLLAEIKGNSLLSWAFGLGQRRRASKLRKALNNVQFCGYSTHHFTISGQQFDIVAARPYSMGGPSINYKPFLQQQFGIGSIEASVQFLKNQINTSISDRLIFLAHNGPHGLGETRSDIWGCDFRAEEGDYGDVDLKLAIDYARSQGKQILAVIAGHMHHWLKGGGTRQWYVKSEDTAYINAARVPRIYQHAGRSVRHYIRLSFNEEQVEIGQVLV
jgi:uncharacterized protein (TIGR04168 family)